MTPTIDSAREAQCDQCGDFHPASDSLTVSWANVKFCSVECRSKFSNSVRFESDIV